MKGRLLVFNCHEAWIHQLRHVPYELDVLVDLPGRDVRGWDHGTRPLPANARCLPWGAHGAHVPRYDGVVCHGLADLRDARAFDGPRLVILHASLEGRVLEEGSQWSADHLRRLTTAFLRHEGATPVAISALKARSWGVSGRPLRPGIEVDDYPAGELEVARGIRVVNHVLRRRRILHWDLHQHAFDGLPITLVGHNPGIWAAERARNWDHLKQLLASHRFIVHTVDPALEDGYNLALLEGMAAGLPVIGNSHPSSPVEHGVSGYLSDDPAELRSYAVDLLADPARARRLGRAARERVRDLFPVRAFIESFEQHLADATAFRARAAADISTGRTA